MTWRPKTKLLIGFIVKCTALSLLARYYPPCSTFAGFAGAYLLVSIIILAVIVGTVKWYRRAERVTKRNLNMADTTKARFIPHCPRCHNTKLCVMPQTDTPNATKMRLFCDECSYQVTFEEITWQRQ